MLKWQNTWILILALLVVCLWVNLFSSLSLSFPICQMRRSYSMSCLVPLRVNILGYFEWCVRTYQFFACKLAHSRSVFYLTVWISPLPASFLLVIDLPNLFFAQLLPLVLVGAQLQRFNSISDHSVPCYAAHEHIKPTPKIRRLVTASSSLSESPNGKRWCHCCH